MAKIQTRNIYTGDSFFIRYLCWRNRKVQEARTQFGGTEANMARDPLFPLEAKVRLVNFETNEVIPLGMNGEVEAEADIENNTIEYLIDPELLTQEGSFRVYTQITLDDNRTMTEIVQFRVMGIT